MSYPAHIVERQRENLLSTHNRFLRCRLEYEERKPSPSDLAADLSTMRQWFSDLRYTKTTIIHGLVHLDCQRLRSILMEPVPKTITGLTLESFLEPTWDPLLAAHLNVVATGMSGMLHATFVHHATEVVSFLKDVVRRLKKRPSDYNSFSLYMTEIGPHLSAAGKIQGWRGELHYFCLHVGR